MRTFIARFVAASVAVLFAANAASAAVPSSALEYLNFAGWNHATIAAGGQTFNDVYEDVDVTVTTIGTHPIASTYSAAGVLTGRDVAGSHSFRFVFSRPLDLVLEVNSVDRHETLSVFTTGTESYMHQFGGSPTVTTPSGGIALNGVGFGVNPTGASKGQIITFADRMTLSYQSSVSSPVKWERFRLATIVPEPNTFLMTALGLVGLALRNRKRNS